MIPANVQSPEHPLLNRAYNHGKALWRTGDNAGFVLMSGAAIIDVDRAAYESVTAVLDWLATQFIPAIQEPTP